jgi:Carboxypeptidase regulatory-like domain
MSQIVTRGLTAVAIVLLLVPAAALAQAFGSVGGTVHDERGDIVAGVSLTLTNIATNATRTTTATKDGGFQFTQTAPGTYGLRAEATGFKPVVRTGVVVQVNTPLSVDLAFEVGAVSETVEVISSAETIDREDATLGNTFDENRIRQLPIEGRNVVDLLSLQPARQAVRPAVRVLSGS